MYSLSMCPVKSGNNGKDNAFCDWRTVEKLSEPIAGQETKLDQHIYTTGNLRNLEPKR